MMEPKATERKRPRKESATKAPIKGAKLEAANHKTSMWVASASLML